jgi:hypothetical protein
MNALEACAWLAHSGIGNAIRQSTWGFALIEMVHLASLALLGGCLLVAALRVFGRILPTCAIADVDRNLIGLATGALSALLTSGVLLFADGPLRYYANVAFRTKLLLLAAALAAAAVTRRLLGQTPPAAAASPNLKAATALTLALWLGVGIAGRVIGIL